MPRVRFSVILVVALVVPILVVGRSKSGNREKIIHTFKAGHDGSLPLSSLVSDAKGNLYGTTLLGGNSKCLSQGCGTVFELIPEGKGGWKEKILYAFKGGTDGANPKSNLILDATGSLYGTAAAGGTVNSSCRNGCGVVFELSPNSNGTWTQTVLYSFQAGSDGAYPWGGLVFDAAGNLFGTTYNGGTFDGWGTVFELSPNSGGGWTETLLYAFQGGTDGTNPESGVALDSAGNLYGTTPYGGDKGWGTLFEVQRSGSQWKETVLYSFLGGGNGGQPDVGGVIVSGGNLYGTLSGGGNGGGAVYELKRVGSGWKEIMLYNFCTLNNCADGAQPEATLLFDKNGNLYGSTTRGGSVTCPDGTSYDCGTVFKLEHSKAGWKETVLYQFGNQSGDGFWPYAGVVFDTRGNLVGTTSEGGAANHGTVFEVHP